MMSTVVAIGKFEGVHLGHQRILTRLTEEAARRGAVPAVFTFTNNPLSFLAPDRCPRAVMSPEQRREALHAFGVEQVVMVPFDEALANLTPEAFVDEYLVRQLHAKHIIVGDDFRFGVNASGNPDVLTTLGETRGFTVEVIGEVADPELGRISSTRVREALAEGDIDEAVKLLGHPHRVRGVVVHGDARGRDLGFPTANLGPKPGSDTVEGFIPADGVYAGIATVDGAAYAAAISVGNNPTFTPEADSRVEAFLLDMSGDLYGKDIELRFIHRIRPMLTFSGIDELLEAMHEDVRITRELVNDSPGRS